jgi:hypothetical protein
MNTLNLAVSLAIFARAADLITTQLVLEAGGRERNRVVKACLDRFGLIGTFVLQILLVAAAASGVTWLAGLDAAKWFLFLIAAQGFGLGIWNYLNLRKLR